MTHSVQMHCKFSCSCIVTVSVSRKWPLSFGLFDPLAHIWLFMAFPWRELFKMFLPVHTDGDIAKMWCEICIHILMLKGQKVLHEIGHESSEKLQNFNIIYRQLWCNLLTIFCTLHRVGKAVYSSKKTLKFTSKSTNKCREYRVSIPQFSVQAWQT